MPDFTDLILRQGSPRTLLVFDQGRQFIDLTGAPSGRISTPISTAAELKAALAMPGVYSVQPGTYTGNFVVSAPNVTLGCLDGVILNPSDVSKPNLQVNAGSFAWNGGVFNGGINDAIIVGSQAATAVEQQPSNVVITGAKVLAPAAGAHRGFALHGVNITVFGCEVLGYYRVGQEAQAIWVHNGPGPYSIIDCHLEAAGENILFGGDTVNIPGCVPSDITIKHCRLTKSEAMHTNAALWKVKNSLELKNARRVVIEDNLIDGCWKGGQGGAPIVFTVRNTGATLGHDNPWVCVDQVLFQHNIVRNCKAYAAINILGHDDGGRASEQTRNISILNNLFEDSPIGVIVNSGVTELLDISNNCFAGIKDGEILMFANSGTKTKLRFNSNTGLTGSYLFFLSGGPGKGTPSLDAACSSYEVAGNMIERSVIAGKVASMPVPPGVTLFAPNTLVLDQNHVLPGASAGWSGPDGIAQ